MPGNLMNPTTYDPTIMDGLFTFFAVQLARIHNQLYPEGTNPMHVRGPRKPDMQEQERAILKRGR
jgi:hypothetical protein